MPSRIKFHSNHGTSNDVFLMIKFKDYKEAYAAKLREMPDWEEWYDQEDWEELAAEHAEEWQAYSSQVLLWLASRLRMCVSHTEYLTCYAIANVSNTYELQRSLFGEWELGIAIHAQEDVLLYSSWGEILLDSKGLFPRTAFDADRLAKQYNVFTEQNIQQFERWARNKWGHDVSLCILEKLIPMCIRDHVESISISCVSQQQMSQSIWKDIVMGDRCSSRGQGYGVHPMHMWAIDDEYDHDSRDAKKNLPYEHNLPQDYKQCPETSKEFNGDHWLMQRRRYEEYSEGLGRDWNFWDEYMQSPYRKCI